MPFVVPTPQCFIALPYWGSGTFFQASFFKIWYKKPKLNEVYKEDECLGLKTK
jgi:hypothetical protein